MEKLNLTIDDITINPSPIVFGSGEYVMQRYLNPVYFDALVVIVKASRPVPPLKMFYANFSDSAQSLSIIIASVFLILCILRARNFADLSFINIFSLTLSITIKHDFRKFLTLKLQEIAVIFPVFIYGFALNNTINSVLTTFYTTKIFYQPDINTLSGIDSISCNIAASRAYSKILSDLSEFNWSSRIVFHNQSEIDHKLFRFDISTCFVDRFRRADILMRYQKRGPRVMHVVNTNLVPQLYGYMIHPMSPHKRRLNELILNVMSSGLYAKWSADIYDELYEEDILKYFVSIPEVRPTSLKIFYMIWPMTVLVWSSLIAVFVFCSEIFISRLPLM